LKVSVNTSRHDRSGVAGSKFQVAVGGEHSACPGLRGEGYSLSQNKKEPVMAKCPACGANLSPLSILTLGSKTVIRCEKCKADLKAQEKVSGIKVFVSVGFLVGGIGGGLSMASGHALQWIAVILVWFLILALADIRYTRLDKK
jgi:hypothetical protein